MAVKHYHYDCIHATERSKLVEKEDTTCKYCLERLGLYKINHKKRKASTEKANEYFKKKEELRKKRQELRKFKKTLI